MEWRALLLIPLLAGCGRSAGDRPAEPEGGDPVQIADLTGLYEGRGAGDRDRMCMVSDPSGTTSFAIVTDSPAGSCAGAGEAVGDADVLRMTMGGDEACVIEARVDGVQVTLPPQLAPGCAYYCAPGATLAGAAFEKTGGTAADAMRATDPAGDPLCG